MPLLEGAGPVRIEGGPVGVLALHGFTSTPLGLHPLTDALAEAGYSVSAPRFPGHGTSLSECNRTTWHDWYAEASRALDELRGTCDTVVVFGFSMGGTLALRLAEERGDQLAGVALLNPSVYTTRPDRHLLPVLAKVVPAWPGIGNDIKKDGVVEQAYSKIPVRAAYSLSQLWKVVKPDLGRVSQPILVMTSPDDHVVEPENSDYILEHVNSVDRHQVVLPESYHVALLDNDSQTVIDATTEFVARVAG